MHALTQTQETMGFALDRAEQAGDVVEIITGKMVASDTPVLSYSRVHMTQQNISVFGITRVKGNSYRKETCKTLSGV